jgi:hypothetical protein
VGLGLRTLQSLALIAEVIHGGPSHFSDPARFSFAHGWKDGHPFPVPLKAYDESLAVLCADHWLVQSVEICFPIPNLPRRNFIELDS